MTLRKTIEVSEKNVTSNCNYELCADILDAITTAEQYRQCLNRHTSLEVFYLYCVSF